MDTDKLIRDMVVKLSKDIYQDSLQPSARTLGTKNSKRLNKFTN